jgi:hypothetical protein
MSQVEIILTCPLGHKCEEVKDGAIHRCNWFTRLAGINPNTGEAMDEYSCAISWLPVLLIENSQQQKSTSAAVESFRNEMVKSNEQILLTASRNTGSQAGKLIDLKSN